MHIGNISATYPQHSISHGNIGQHSIVSATNIQPGNIQSDFGNIQSGNIQPGNIQSSYGNIQSMPKTFKKN